MKTILLFLLIFTLVNAADTKTITTFGNELTLEDDEYGNSVYQREVSIKTTDFKVKNFWSRFFNPENDELNHALVSKSATLKIKVEATSACVLDNELPPEGCSGQKPFLISQKVLDNPIVAGGDEYEVIFSLAEDFNILENQNFYPLDIKRDEQYYRESAAPHGGGSKHSFFGFITGIFDFLFDKTIGIELFGQGDIADINEAQRSDEAQDRRERYIANIIAGVEKNYRMTKEYKRVRATQINVSTKLNIPTSLLSYAEAKKTTEQKQCKLLFLDLSNDGLLCRVASGFGMDIWMPFFTKSQTKKIEVNTIMADTENALLAMTSKIEKVPYMEDVGGSDNTKLSFLQNLLKPVTTVVSLVKRLLFGSSKEAIAAEPFEREYEFAEDKAMTLSMAVTNDGTQVDDFANFKLLKIRSVYGDKMNSCKVKHTGLLGITIWNETFKEGEAKSKESPNSTIFNHEIWNQDQWITWCQGATNKKGIFSALFDSTDGNFNLIDDLLNSISTLLSTLFSSYKVLDFENSLTRALVLNIKKVELDPLSELNRQTIEIVKID